MATMQMPSAVTDAWWNPYKGEKSYSITIVVKL
jgi:hypothetical protein